MIPKKPAPDVIRVVTGFPIRSCSEKLRRRRLLTAILIALAAAEARAAAAGREAAQVVEHAGPALAARQRTIERCERAGEAFILVIDPGAQHRCEHHRKALVAN